MTRLRRTTSLALLATVCACSSSVFGGEPMVSVSLGSQRPLPSGTLLDLDIGGRHIRTGPTQDVASAFVAPRYGAVDVRADLLSPAGEILASASFSQSFQRGAQHYIVAHVGLNRPAPACRGTVTAAPLAAPPESQAAPDTLFVLYGTIPPGIVC